MHDFIPYREPAPRYSKPVRPSKLPRLPRGVRRALARERRDHMLALGFALGSLAVMAATVIVSLQG